MQLFIITDSRIFQLTLLDGSEGTENVATLPRNANGVLQLPSLWLRARLRRLPPQKPSVSNTMKSAEVSNDVIDAEESLLTDWTSVVYRPPERLQVRTSWLGQWQNKQEHIAMAADIEQMSAGCDEGRAW